MKYQAVIFDLDGTLLNSLEDLANSMNRVLGDFGYPGHRLEEYRYFVGDGMENLVRRALPAGIQDAEFTSCLQAMVEEYGRHAMVKTRSYKGIPELLESLAGRDIKMAVFSNKPDELTKMLIAGLLPHWRFNPVWGARPGVPKKPDPSGALEIASSINVLPEQVLYLGDTGTDMKTATAAGMYAVGALWGFRTADELLKAGAQVLVEKPLELLHLL
ncbi:MAG: HAD family hydrolase [Bacillota bacterium]